MKNYYVQGLEDAVLSVLSKDVDSVQSQSQSPAGNL